MESVLILIKSLLFKCDRVDILKSHLNIFIYKFSISQQQKIVEYYVSEKLMHFYYNINSPKEPNMLFSELEELDCLKKSLLNVNNNKVYTKDIEIRPMSYIESINYSKDYSKEFCDKDEFIFYSNKFKKEEYPELYESLSNSSVFNFDEDMVGYNKWMNYLEELEYDGYSLSESDNESESDINSDEELGYNKWMNYLEELEYDGYSLSDSDNESESDINSDEEFDKNEGMLGYNKWMNFVEDEYNYNSYFRHNFKYNNRNINKNLNTEYILFNKNIKLDLNILVFKSIDPLTKSLIFNLYNVKTNKYLIITTNTKIINRQNKNRTDTFYFNHFSFNEDDRILRLSCFINLNTFCKYSETWYNFYKNMVRIIINFNNFYKVDYSISFYRVIADLKFISKEYKKFCIEHTLDNNSRFIKCIADNVAKNFYILKYFGEDTLLFSFIKLKRYNVTKDIYSYKYKIPFKPTIYFNESKKKYCLISAIDSFNFKKNKTEYQLLLPKLPFKLESQTIYCKKYSILSEPFLEQYETEGLNFIKNLEKNVKN